MFKYVNVTKNRPFRQSLNSHLLPQIVEIFLDNHNVLFDDYHQKSDICSYDSIVEFIDALYPHFWAVLTLTKPHKLIGFIYLDNWRGSETELHSCNITTAAKKEYWGETVFLAGLAFLDYIVKTYKLKKVTAEVFEHNHKVAGLLKKIGFEPDGILKNHTMKNGKPINIKVFSYFTHYLKEN